MQGRLAPRRVDPALTTLFAALGGGALLCVTTLPVIAALVTTLATHTAPREERRRCVAAGRGGVERVCHRRAALPDPPHLRHYQPNAASLHPKPHPPAVAIISDALRFPLAAALAAFVRALATPAWSAHPTTAVHLATVLVLRRLCRSVSPVSAREALR